MEGVALVAGASSGLGRAVAERLAREGYVTYAGARSYRADMQTTGKTPPAGCIPLGLDVTDGASVREAVELVLKAQGRIDALINCAAFLTLGSCEETSVSELDAVIRTNLLGMVSVTQAVLPAMRRQGFGRVVQFSSLNGRFGIPFQGAYAASKHAIEGWSEALAMEVRRYGISVTLMEPGDCQSGAQTYRTHAQGAQAAASPYQAYYAAATRRIHHDETTGLMPDKVARAVARVIGRRHPPARVVVARIDQRLALWLHRFLPGRWFYRIIEGYYSPGKSARRKDDEK